jgi:hypothetical protein
MWIDLNAVADCVVPARNGMLSSCCWGIAQELILSLRSLPYQNKMSVMSVVGEIACYQQLSETSRFSGECGNGDLAASHLTDRSNGACSGFKCKMRRRRYPASHLETTFDAGSVGW